MSSLYLLFSGFYYRTSVNIPVQSFEHHIKASVLQSGLTFYTKGNLDSIEEPSVGTYRASFRENGEEHEVELVIHQNQIQGFNCTCREAKNPICKHGAALLFHTQADLLGLEVKAPKRRKTAAKKAKPKTAKEKFAAFVESISEEELRAFVIAQAEKDKDFKSLLSFHFIHLSEKESTTIYKSYVSSIIKKSKGSARYFSQAKINVVIDEVEELLARAESAIEDDNYLRGFYIASGVLEAITLKSYLGGYAASIFFDLAESACDVIYLLTDKDLDQKEHKKVFSYLLKTFNKRSLESTRLQQSMIQLAIAIRRTEEDGRLIIKHLRDFEQKVDVFSRLSYEVFMLEVINEIEGVEAREKFINTHLGNPEIKEIALTAALAKKDVKSARRILLHPSDDNMVFSLHEMTNWKIWEFRIFTLEAGPQEILKEAMKSIKKYPNHFMEYAAAIKMHTPPKAWKKKADELMNLAQNISVGMFFEFSASEKRWGELWDKLQTWGIMTGQIAGLGDKLKEEDTEGKEEFLKFLEKGLKHDLAHFNNQEVYQSVINVIRSIQDMGGSSRALQLIQELRQDYPRRNKLESLLDQLKLVVEATDSMEG